MGYFDDAIERKEEYLEHHGIRGQKWGVRRFQNPDGSLTQKGKKRYLDKVYKDMNEHFKSNISKEAAKVSSLNKNGTDSRGSSWNDAYRKGKVTSKDDAQIKKAAKDAYAYAKQKYGESAIKALSKSGVLGRKIDDFDAAATKSGKDLLNSMLKKDGQTSSQTLSSSMNKIVKGDGQNSSKTTIVGPGKPKTTFAASSSERNRISSGMYNRSYEGQAKALADKYKKR